MHRLKRLTILFCVAIVLVALSGAMSTGLAGQGATVIRNIMCHIMAADWGGSVDLHTRDGQVIVSPSGNAQLTCRFAIPAGLAPSSATVYTDFACITPVGSATSSYSIVSPAGVTLRCSVVGK